MPILRYCARSFVSLLIVAGLANTALGQVFVNEIHYDNSGADSGEAIELAGFAGTDLGGWDLVLYNGSNGTVYNTVGLSGVFADQQGGLGTLVFEIAGIQNGAPDGIALVDAGGNLVQFLSYEGSFTAIGGPADGQVSTDIGVSEASSTAVGDSLQLSGAGSFPNNFVWSPPQPNSFGTVNNGQVFGGGEPPSAAVVINEIDYDQPGADSAEFIELLSSGDTAADLGEYSLVLVNGNGGAIYSTVDLPAIALPVGEYFVVCANAANTANCDLDVADAGFQIQNGSPDAVALLRNGEVADTVSYEGDTAAPYTEGSGNGLADSSSTAFTGISRSPDGTDSNVNNVDFGLRCITPGESNSADSENCPDPLVGPPLVINEINADPDTSSGDSNNDGVANFSDDEFLEIVNVSGADLDISGWSLSDGAAERHVFPAGTVIADQCSIVVFGGGEPLGGFGGAVTQVASTGALGLNNSGDTVTVRDLAAADVAVAAYGSQGGSNQSVTLVPDVTGSEPYIRHTEAPGSSGALFSPGTRVDGSLFDGCEEPLLGPFEIFEIQGDGESSPYAGQLTITQNNVVTALSGEGFFMQTPESRSDANVDTSDGILVFTGSAPAVAVGDTVDVTGRVVEFFGYTEFSDNPQVTVVGSGAALPAPVVFDESRPSQDPLTPSCAIEFECYEGMLITIPNGTVTASNQSFGPDPVAEVFITARSSRAFREPGIEFPGEPGLPVWDGNPEVFELDPDKLGLPNQLIPGGSSFTATGILGFEFGGYELWPSTLEVNAAALPRAVRSKNKHEITVGSLNLFRLFDDVDNPPTTNAAGQTLDDFVVSTEEYQRRLGKFAGYIVNNMRSPDILAVQEVESLAVLQDLAAAIAPLDRKAKYEAFLEEGNDIGSIDVGFLVRKKVKVRGITQLGATETYVEPNGDIDLLHDRPPLLLEVRVRGKRSFRQLFVMAVHNRSLGGIDGSSGERVRIKRLEQAQSIAAFVQDIQSANPKAGLVVTGDFNGFEFSDGYVDVVGQIRGDVVPADNQLSGPDLVDPDLMNQVFSLPPEERYSFIFRGSAQVLDHALTNSVLDLRVRGLQFARGNADAAIGLIDDPATSLRSSDHDGLVLYIERDVRKHRHDGDDDHNDDEDCEDEDDDY